MNITGDVTGGAGGVNAGGANQTSNTGTMNIYGAAIGTPSNSGAWGASNTGTGTMFVQISRSNDYPNSSITLPAVGTQELSTSGFITIDAMEFGSGGVAPIVGRHFVRDAGTNYVKMRQSNAGTITTIGELANDYPAAANVRYGTSYDFGALTGTCRVPGASSVLSGVLVDATSGTATISASDIRTAIGMSSANLDTQLATLQTSATGIKGKTDSLTFTVAGQVDSNVVDWKGATAPAMTGDAYERIGAAGAGLTALGDTRLANLDAAVSTRSTFAGGAVASVTGSVGSVVGLNVSYVDAAASAIKAKTDQFVFTVAGQVDANALSGGINAAGIRSAIGLASANLDDQLDALPTNAELGTALASADDATLAQLALVKAQTDNLPADPADQSLLTAATDAIMSRLGTPAAASIAADIADKTGYRLSAVGIDDLLRTNLVEGYAAAGAPLTVEQALHMIWSMLSDKGIVGTTLTTRQLDGGTAAMTFALDKAKAPTDQARST